MRNRPYLIFPAVALTAVLTVYFFYTLLTMQAMRTWRWWEVREVTAKVTAMLMAGSFLLTGVARCRSLHPRFNPKYAAWLSSTPWNLKLNLPLGPVHLVWEDLLFVVPLTFIAEFDAHIFWLLPITFYLLGYSVTAVASMRGNSLIWFAFALAFFWSIAILEIRSPTAIFTIAVVSGALAHLALDDSLRHFPWDMGDSMRDFKRRPLSSLPWPINRIGPGIPMQPIPQMVGWTSAILAGWWTFVLISTADPGDRVYPMQFSLVCLSVGCLGRLVFYRQGYGSPISLSGRLAIGRRIIPRFDIVYFAPLLIGLATLGLPMVLEQRIPMPVLAGLVVTSTIAIGLNCGPTLRSWRLTGHHRMVAASSREPQEPKVRTVGR